MYGRASEHKPYNTSMYENHTFLYVCIEKVVCMHIIHGRPGGCPLTFQKSESIRSYYSFGLRYQGISYKAKFVFR